MSTRRGSSSTRRCERAPSHSEPTFSNTLPKGDRCHRSATGACVLQLTSRRAKKARANGRWRTEGLKCECGYC
eukprot:536373-Prymnesium_polylepis.2